MRAATRRRCSTRVGGTLPSEARLNADRDQWLRRRTPRHRGRLLPRRVLRAASACSAELRATLEKLRKLVPDDADLAMDLVKVYRTHAQVRRGGRAAARAREEAAGARARGLPADQRDQDRGAQGRRGDRVGAEGAREEPERSARRTSGSASATSRCSGSPTRSPRTRRRSSSIRATQGRVRARRSSTSRPARR